MKIKINWEVIAVAIIMIISFFIVGTLEKANEQKYQAVMSEVYQTEPIIIQPKTTYHPTPQIQEPEQEPEQIQQELPEILIPCGISEDELATQIKGLAPYANAFLQAEEQYGINAKLLIAISALESGWGTSELAKTNNNLFGWTSSSGYASFNTVEECITYVAWFLKNEYLSPGGQYFEGYGVDDINVHYNGRPEWARVVNEIMGMIGQ